MLGTLSLPLLGSLRNGDGDGNEDGKKAIGLDWQNNNFTSVRVRVMVRVRVRVKG